MGRIRSLGVMVDCSRDAVYTVGALKEYFALLSGMGYSSVQLYTEDVYEVDGEPYFGYLRGRYTKAELKELDAAAKACGLELIPCIQTLAHLGGITRWPAYANITDTGDILLAEEDRTYELIENMFRTCAECFSSRRINIGMDEAHMVGLGKYLDKHGFKDRFAILLKHLERVNEIALRYGFRPMMWSDMFFRLANEGAYYCKNGSIPKQVIEVVPENVELVYWDYYSTDEEHYSEMIRAHQQFRNKIVFAGGAWSWSGFAPANRFSIRATECAMRACADGGIDDVFITCWKDDGAECSLFATLPTLLCAAEYARGNFAAEKIAEKFRRITGVNMEDFLALEGIDMATEKTGIRNPHKYMLYSDPFLGFLDRTTLSADGSGFAAVRERLAAGKKSRRYGYIFNTLARLCDVLRIKYTLGQRTRAAYRRNDASEMSLLIEDYKKLELAIGEFYRAFRAQWDRECKPNGFEKHDIRIGGLRQRIKHCREMLESYANGKTASISALEEEILPFADLQDGQSALFNDWLTTAMIKPKI